MGKTIKNDKLQYFTNTAKRLPIVFCLDISPSMGWRIGNNSTSMELLNAAVKRFIAELNKDPKARAAAEVAIVTFSTDVQILTGDVDGKAKKFVDFDEENPFLRGAKKFFPLSELTDLNLEAVEEGGTNTSEAVIKSINLINTHRKNLAYSEIGYYAPFFVLVTDGDPDDTDDQEMQNDALTLIRAHCHSTLGASEIIVPFIIGVGDHINPATLDEYAKGFADGYFPIKGNARSAEKDFGKVFRFIGNSAIKTIDLGKSGKSGQLDPMTQGFKDLINELAGR